MPRPTAHPDDPTPSPGARRRAVADPGNARRTYALSAVLAIAVSVLADFFVAKRFDLLELTVAVPNAPGGQVRTVSHAVALVVAAMAAMVMVISPLPPTPWARVKAMAAKPPAFLAGCAVGAVLEPYRVPSIVALCLMATGMVLVQRFPKAAPFGLPIFFGAFIAIFVHLEPAHLGWVALLITVGPAAAIAAHLGCFWPDPQRTLTDLLRTFEHAAVEVEATSAALLRGDGGREAQLAVRRASRTLARIALLVEANLAGVADQLGEDETAALHRRLFDREAALHALARASIDFVRSEHDPDERRAMADALHHLGRGNASTARLLAEPHLTAARQAWREGRQQESRERLHSLRASARLGLAVTELAEVALRTEDPGDAHFRPTVATVGGALAGSGPLAARALAPPEDAPTPLLAPVLVRRAVRMILAVSVASVVGMAISDARWYWAFFTAFSVMMAANTATEHVVVGLERALGTAAGVVVGILLAHALADVPLVSFAVIFGALGVQFYFQQPSAILNTFGSSIVVSQLYVQLGSYSDSVLLTRIWETASGAAVAIVVSLLVFRVPTATVARVAVRHHAESIALVLRNVLDHLTGGRPSTELRADVRGAQETWYQLRQVVEPSSALTRGRRRRELSAGQLALLGRITTDAANLARRASAAPEVGGELAEHLREAGDDLQGLLLLVAGSGTAPEPTLVDPPPSMALDAARASVELDTPEQTVIRELTLLEEHLLELVASLAPGGPTVTTAGLR